MAAQDAKPSPSSKDVLSQQATESISTSNDDLVVCAAKASTEDSTNTSKTTEISRPSDDQSEKGEETAGTSTAMSTSTLKDPPTPQELPTYESSESSEQYQVAKALLNEGDFERAMELIEEGIEETKATLLSMGVTESDLHESMAPFHYLYGTVLLYSIEESNDTQMMTVGQQQAQQPPEGEEGTSSDPAAAPEESGGDANNNSSSDANNAFVEDMEIAWENLDTARNIVELIFAQQNLNNAMSETRKNKLQLDLSQILLREGDLQRMNGRYPEAIRDYDACLQLRQTLLPPFDRKIADAQYNLGLSYLSHSTEIQKDENLDASKLQTAQQHCQEGVKLYEACARTICGQIAGLCAIDADDLLNTEADEPRKAGLKITGLDEAAVAAGTASQTLSLWRSKVANLTPVESDDPRFTDLKELLDEIQETIDEAERSQLAVREAAKLRIQAQKGITVAEDGSSTQIGFGQPSQAATKTMNASTPAAAAPMMVVKKKKKRPDSAAAPDEENDAKKARTE